MARSGGMGCRWVDRAVRWVVVVQAFAVGEMEIVSDDRRSHGVADDAVFIVLLVDDE